MMSLSRFCCFQDLSERVESYLPEFNSTIKCGEDVIKEPSVESAAKEKVEDELLSLKERLRGINNNLDSLTSRYVRASHRGSLLERMFI
jgi:predicted nuclease with TOPRIM domain